MRLSTGIVVALSAGMVTGTVLTAQVYRPAQGIGLPEGHRDGAVMTLPGVEDLEHPQARPAAPLQRPDAVDTSIHFDTGKLWHWFTGMLKSLWESLTWPWRNN